MAFGQEIYNMIPNEGYMLVHLVEILLGVYLAKMAKEGNHNGWTWLFLFYAVNGVVFELAHVTPQVVTLPFAHLVSQVLLLIGFILVYLDMKK